MDITAIGGTPPAAKGALAEKAKKAGSQFEAVLLNNVLGDLEKTFTELPGGKKDRSTDAYSGLGVQTLTTSFAERGGVGLGKLVAKALEKNQRHPEK